MCLISGLSQIVLKIPLAAMLHPTGLLWAHRLRGSLYNQFLADALDTQVSIQTFMQTPHILCIVSSSLLCIARMVVSHPLEGLHRQLFLLHRPDDLCPAKIRRQQVGPHGGQTSDPPSSGGVRGGRGQRLFRVGLGLGFYSIGGVPRRFCLEAQSARCLILDVGMRGG